jgi:hypothetical protein
MSYLRTRLRVARSVAVLGPLVGLSVAIWLTTPGVSDWRAGQVGPDAPWIQVPEDRVQWLWAALPAVIFACSFAAALHLPGITGVKVPRTNKAPGLGEWDLGKRRDVLQKALVPYSVVARAPLRLIYWPCLLAVAFQWLGHVPAIATLAGLAGIALGALATWVWERVLQTYLVFLSSAARQLES